MYSRRSSYSRRGRDSVRKKVTSNMKVTKRSSTRDQAMTVRAPVRAIKALHFYPSSQAAVAFDAKYFNWTMDYNGGAAENSILLNSITQGDGISERTQARIFMRTLLLRIGVQLPTEAATTAVHPGILSIIVWYDHDPLSSASIPAGNLLLDDLDPLANANLDGSERFQILYRREFVVAPSLTFSSTGAVVRSIESISSLRCIELKVPIFRQAQWTKGSTTGALSGLKVGALWVSFITNEAPSTTGNYRAFVARRLAFNDVD